MINKDTMPILLSLVLLHSFPLAALAGGAPFVGLGPGSGVSAGVSVFSRHGGPRASIFIRLGNRRAPAPWGYYVPQPVFGSYPINPQGQFSGTDPSGGFYINGYRVLPSGWLKLQVEPNDAEVLVDGFTVPIDQKSGSSASLGLSVGMHQVEVRKPGFQSVRSSVEIKQAGESALQVTLNQ